MRTQGPHDILVQRLDERRYALSIDGIVRYVGTEEECQRRLSMLVPNNDRAGQDKALGTAMADNALTLSRPRMAMRLSRRWMGRDGSADLIPQEGCAQGLQQCRPAWGAAFLCRVWRPATDHKLPRAMQYAQDFSVLCMCVIVE